MSEQEKGFLDAIFADPSDESARLIYADWLEEEGGRPRKAEFIRAKGKLKVSYGNDPWNLRNHATPFKLDCNAPDRDRRVLVDYWRINLSHETPPFDHLIWWRGFVDEVTSAWDTWDGPHGDLIRVKHPVRFVNLQSLPEISIIRLDDIMIREMDAVVDFRAVMGGKVRYTRKFIDKRELRFRRPNRDVIGEVTTEAVYELLARSWPGIRFSFPEEAINQLVRLFPTPINQ